MQTVATPLAKMLAAAGRDLHDIRFRLVHDSPRCGYAHLGMFSIRLSSTGVGLDPLGHTTTFKTRSRYSNEWQIGWSYERHIFDCGNRRCGAKIIVRSDKLEPRFRSALAGGARPDGSFEVRVG